MFIYLKAKLYICIFIYDALGKYFQYSCLKLQNWLYSTYWCHECKLNIGLINDALQYKYCFLNVNFIRIDNDYKYGSCFSWLNSCPKAFHVSDLEWVTFWYKPVPSKVNEQMRLNEGHYLFVNLYANLVLVDGSWYHLQIFI